MGRKVEVRLLHLETRRLYDQVVAEHKGQSVVPSRIRIRAGLVATANACAWTIEVW